MKKEEKKTKIKKESSQNVKNENTNYNNILDFFYETGMLKRLPRTGWFMAHVKHPESIGDHVSRSVFIAYILAKMEGANPKDTALICAFHELGEARISDFNRVQSTYFPDRKVSEKNAVTDQLKLLPKDIAEELGFYILNDSTDNSKEQIVAKDADYLECMLQAKEYLEQGYTHTQNWIDNCKKCLSTESAKKFAELINDSNSHDWYQKLKKIARLQK